MGIKTIHLLGRVQGRVDTAYRDELTERFQLDPTKKCRAYSKGIGMHSAGAISFKVEPGFLPASNNRTIGKSLGPRTIATLLRLNAAYVPGQSLPRSITYFTVACWRILARNASDE